MLKVLEHKLEGCMVAKEILSIMSSSQQTPSNNDDNKTTNEDLKTTIHTAMEREFRFGKDVRWFSRVVSSALTLYRHDVLLANSGATTKPPPTFQPHHMLDALVMMGASISDDSHATSATQQPNLCLVDDCAVDPRLQALLDLSKPQVALLLCARRILAREDQRENEQVPLTLQRMFQEYQSFRRGTVKHTSLHSAAMALLERGLLVPSMDHSGGGPLHYHVSYSYKTLDPYSLSRLPLQLPMDIERELGEALNRNVLDCSTALRDWGRKVH
jgi:hypothetical protein